MRAPHRLSAVLLAASLLALAVACDRGDGERPTPTATASTPATSTAAPTPTVEPTREPTPAPTAPPSATPPPWPAHHPAGTRTGVSEVDAVIAALEAVEVDALVALALVQELECVPSETRPGVGALTCQEGEQPGEPLRVFPSAVCEGFWYRESQLREHLQQFADSVLGVYAVVEVPDVRADLGGGGSVSWEYVISLTSRRELAPGLGGGQSAYVGGCALVLTTFGCGGPGVPTSGSEPPMLLLPPPES